MTVLTVESPLTSATQSGVTIPHGIVDDRRGSWAMVLFIVTEACLFVLLFFSYFYLGHLSRGPWPPEPPKLALALVMLVVLIASSGILHWGELAERRGSTFLARVVSRTTRDPPLSR